MKITAVDPIYVKMPEVNTAADGTQDSFLCRVRTDEGLEGWGESDASPLVCAAAYCCPMSHGNIINIRESLLGETLDGPEDVYRLHAKATRLGMDIQQIHHAYSAADIALWDLVGKKLKQPVYTLLDGASAKSFPKRPYASVLFGDTPELTRKLAEKLRGEGFTAAKFGWGPMGKVSRENDIALVREARAGLGPEAALLIDAGVVWGHDWETAHQRAADFAPFKPGWLEEPLLGDAIGDYRKLVTRKPAVPIAAGEGSGRYHDAEDMLLNGGVNFIQIDVGRIGGITPAHRVRKLAEAHNVTYVNHTFKSHVSIAASIHVFASVESFKLLEYVQGGSPMSQTIVADPLLRGPDGLVRAPEKPGLGITMNLDAVRKYLAPVRIDIGGQSVLVPASV
jgi:L-alanine-DL-glutamate epimerase-like enolase superfamily enzyme